MEPATRNSVVAGALVAVIGVAALTYTPPPPSEYPLGKFQREPGRVYPRRIQARNQPDWAYKQMMDGLAKTNAPGSKVYLPVKK